MSRYELDDYVQEQVADDAVYANFVVSRRSYADTESRVESLFDISLLADPGPDPSTDPH
jgi:hypothetical protein